MEKLVLLESVLGQGVKTNRDYYQFMCPFHQGMNGPKLGVSMNTGKWKCWVCGANGGKVTVLLNKLRADASTISKAKSLFSEGTFTKKESTVTYLSLPKEFVPLWEKSSGFYYDKARGYLLKRGLTELDILKHKIGYCDHGRYRDMIVFPFYDENGALVYFTARSYLPNSLFKFSTPVSVEKDRVYDENMVNWSEPLTLVESKLDAIVVRRNAIPLNGKQISRSLFDRILEEGVSVIYLCLDGDAIKEIMQYSSWFSERGIDVYAVELPLNEEETAKQGKNIYHDPASLGYERVWHYIDNSKKITEVEGFKYKILNRLWK